MNNDFKVILEAMIDKSSLSDIQKEVAKKQLKISADIDIKDFAKDKKKLVDEFERIGKEINKILGDSLDSKEATKWAKELYHQIVSNAKQAAKAQDDLNKAQKNHKLAEQEKYYKRIIDNNKEIYKLQEKRLTANREESREIDRQIRNLNKRNKRAYDSISQKGLGDIRWGSKVYDSEKELKNSLALKQAHLQGKENAREQAEFEKQIADYNEEQLEYIRLRNKYKAEGEKQAQKVYSDYAEQSNNIKLSIDNKSYEAEISRITNGFKNLSGDIVEAKTHTESLNKAYKTMVDATDDFTRIEAEKKYQFELSKTKNLLTIAQAEAKEYVDALKVNKLRNDIQDWLKKNTAATKEAKDVLVSYVRFLELNPTKTTQAEFNNIKSDLDNLDTIMRQIGNLGKSSSQTFREYVKSFVEWSISSGAVMETIQAVKTLIDNVVSLEDKLLELSKVSNLSSNGLAEITKQAYELGETVGKTGTQVIEAATEFKRAGYAMQDSMEMAEAALVMTNVAEGITETSDAAGTLISVLKGFGMVESDAMSIVDMINSASNQSPIEFDRLAEGLERTSGTLAQSGNTIQQTIGLLTAGYAQLRNVEKVSQGLITISARIRGVGEDGETIDGLASKMSEDFGKIGVAVENADGSLRSIYQIAQDYSKVLPNLTDKQKQYYAELAAGKHQVTVWNAIVKQFEDAENATAQAINSVGSASEENQKYLESISGKVSIFESAVESLSNTLLDSDMLKYFIDLGTVGVKSVDELVNALTPLGTLAITLGSILGATNLG